jgi:hypothetical protein
MFDQIPNRRITQRRQSLKHALIAAWSLAFAIGDVWRAGRIGWGTLGWAVVFILSVHSYWKGRHEDPWNPPDEDGRVRHYGALERADVSEPQPEPWKY